ncbi:ABC transporter permease, partial [candidate division KSB1 bacterium]
TVNIAFDPVLVDSKWSSNPIFSVFGGLDLTFIVKIVLSLFAILFTYDAIVGEKERGTLKLALSNPVPRDRLILGKAIGGFISLLMPLIIPLIMGLLILTVIPDVVLSNSDWMRIGVIFVLFLLYLSVFFTLGLFVSSLTQKSSSSFLILLFIWVVFVTVLPKVAVLTAGRVYPIPSIHEVNAEKEAFISEISQRGMEERQQWVTENPNDQTPEWPEKYRAYLEELQQGLTDEIDAKNEQIEEAYQSKRNKQSTMATNFARVISPASALMFGSMSLGKTGIDEHERFSLSIKMYKPEFTKWANAKLMSSINMQTGQLGPVDDLESMPKHAFQSVTLKDSILKAKWDFFLMIGLIFVFFVGSYAAFMKYDVR